MTDVRDPEPRLDERRLDVSLRATLVSRALAPIRRATGYDLATKSPGEVDLSVDRSLDLEIGTKSYAGIIRWSFIFVVLAPMFMAGVYFFLWASDQYVAEARFAVRQADPVSGMSTSGEKGGESSSGGLSADLKTQDASIVANYIKSRAIIDDVSRKLNIREIFQRPEADAIARLPVTASIEDLTAYWDRMVSVYIEGSSGIVTVSAGAFRRDDALALVSAILESSETLVNSLSLKMRADQTRLAENEVRRSEGEVRFALANLQNFRNAEHIIDPVESSISTGKILLQLLGDRSEAEGQLYVAQRAQGPDAPGMTSLHAKLDSINSQIKQLQEQLAGDENESKNMAATLTRFEELELKEKFAEHMFTFAQNGVERARIAALRQTIYLAVFVQPSLPQEYTYPLRGTDFALISIAALMIWICGMTISASVLDHRV